MNLKELRISNGYTQKEIADKIKTNRVNYNRYELEKGEPDIKTLCKLADLYHVSLDELIGRNHDNFIDKGLLSDTELKIFEIMKNLNQSKIEKLESYAVALLQTQDDEQAIINKFKNKGVDQ